MLNVHIFGAQNLKQVVIIKKKNLINIYILFDPTKCSHVSVKTSIKIYKNIKNQIIKCV